MGNISEPQSEVKAVHSLASICPSLHRKGYSIFAFTLLESVPVHPSKESRTVINKRIKNRLEKKTGTEKHC
jgi:hypothetical protein